MYKKSEEEPFQSTLPVGGATQNCPETSRWKQFQSTLPVGGATRLLGKQPGDILISIHAPRGGSDTNPAIRQRRNGNFNPRSPWGERPHADGALPQTLPISIHAPRGGSDPIWKHGEGRYRYFNPRSPWGERLCVRIYRPFEVGFQSTLPVGGATISSSRAEATSGISIHAPRGGSDRTLSRSDAGASNFNPRSPWGERRSGWGPGT